MGLGVLCQSINWHPIEGLCLFVYFSLNEQFKAQLQETLKNDPLAGGLQLLVARFNLVERRHTFTSFSSLSSSSGLSLDDVMLSAEQWTSHWPS